MVRVLISTSLFEVLYISFQAALGGTSHHNTSDAFHARMFGLMAIAAVLLSSSQVVLAWALMRSANTPGTTLFRHAVITGLLVTRSPDFFFSGMQTGAHAPAEPCSIGYTRSCCRTWRSGGLCVGLQSHRQRSCRLRRAKLQFFDNER